MLATALLAVLLVAVGTVLPVRSAGADGPALWASAETPGAPGAATPPRNPFDGPVGGERLGQPGVVAEPGEGQPSPPDVAATAYLVADLDSGEVLAAMNAHERYYPASTLKMLTAVTVIPRLDPRAVYTATEDDAAVEGNTVGLVPGDTYTVDDLLHGLFLQSGNDAAVALARAAGGITETVDAMNAEAARLGAYDTHAVNPSGLDEPGQLSSAYDLTLIARAGMAEEAFRDYAATQAYDFPGRPEPADPTPAPSRSPGRTPTPTPTPTTYPIVNHNDLLANYPGAFGVKTGYTTLARNTMVGAAERDGRRLLVCVLGVERPTWEKAAALLDWGFAATEAEPVGELVTPEQVAERSGATTAPTDQVPDPESTQPISPTPESPAATGPGPGRPAMSWLALGVLGAVFVVLAAVQVRAATRSRRTAAVAAGRAPGADRPAGPDVRRDGPDHVG